MTKIIEIKEITHNVETGEVTETIIETRPMTYEELLAEVYQLRAAEYPDYREYLDGIVKGDTAQVQTYIDACLAVKAKYPKPDEV